MILKRILSYWTPKAPLLFVYMLQQVGYEADKFALWVFSLPSLHKLQRRGQLQRTKRAAVSVVISYLGWSLPIIMAIWLSIQSGQAVWLGLMLLAPLSSITLLSLVSVGLQVGFVDPRFRQTARNAEAKLDLSSATRIAVLGSYGKSTMKELLLAVLSEKYNTAATPENKNVLVSQARWVMELSGKEEILIFEFGEARPGDIARMARLSSPEYAVVTGLAPAHLDDYGSLETIAADFAEISAYAKSGIFVNAEAPELTQWFGEVHQYSFAGVDGWSISDVQATLEGTDFLMQKHQRSVTVHSPLIGLHQVGPLATAVALGAQLGLDDAQLGAGIAKAQRVQHRLDPYQLGGAWIIDDTYNGNIEGARAGLQFLSELAVQGKKMYVTPGLVEQGMLTEQVHHELGTLIAAAQPDRVVLMRHSVTPYIQAGLDEAGYRGELLLEDNPLQFYQNLESYVAAGDVVLLQNDWPDSYR